MTTIAELRADLGQRLRAVYVLLGQRSMTDRARAVIEAVALPKGTRGATVERVRVVDDPKPARALDLVRELVMFGPRRVVELRGFEEAPAELARAVLAYVAKPVREAVLIVSSEGLPAAAPRKKLASALKDVGLLVDLVETKPVPFAIAVARAEGKELSAELAERIVRVVGTHLDILEQEVVKLVTYSGADPIDDAAIDAVCPTLTEPVIWQLSNGLDNGDADAVLDVAQRIGQDIGGAIRLTGVAGSALRKRLASDEARGRLRFDPAASMRRFANVTREAREGSDAVNALHRYLLGELQR